MVEANIQDHRGFSQQQVEVLLNKGLISSDVVDSLNDELMSKLVNRFHDYFEHPEKKSLAEINQLALNREDKQKLAKYQKRYGYDEKSFSNFSEQFLGTALQQDVFSEV